MPVVNCHLLNLSVFSCFLTLARWFTPCGSVCWVFMARVLSVSRVSLVTNLLHQLAAVPDPGEAPAAVAEMCISAATRPIHLTLCPLPTLLATPPHLSLFFYHFLTIKPTTLPSPHQVLFGSLQFEAMNQRVVILDQEPVEFVIEWRRSRKSKGSISPPNSSRPILTRY